MKEYVLDDRAPDLAPAPIAAVDPAVPYRRWPWRALLVLVIVEPLALGALYVALAGGAGAVVHGVVQPPATIAAFAFPHGSDTSDARDARAAADVPVMPERASRIAFEHSRYVIELHGADATSALAMLTRATRAKVIGGDVLLRASAPISRSVAVATAAEAWQAVFGDVASFAVGCAASGCIVHVVASQSGGANATAAPAAEDVAPPAIAPPAAEPPQTPASTAPQQTNYSDDY